MENLRVKLLIVKLLLGLEDKEFLAFAVMQTRCRWKTGGHMHELILLSSHLSPFSELNKNTHLRWREFHYESYICFPFEPSARPQKLLSSHKRRWKLDSILPNMRLLILENGNFEEWSFFGVLTTKPYSQCYAPKFTMTMTNTIYKVPYCVYLTFPQIFSLRQDCTISNMYNKFRLHSVPAFRGFAALGNARGSWVGQQRPLWTDPEPLINA